MENIIKVDRDAENIRIEIQDPLAVSSMILNKLTIYLDKEKALQLYDFLRAELMDSDPELEKILGAGL